MIKNKILDIKIIFKILKNMLKIFLDFQTYFCFTKIKKRFLKIIF